MNENIKLNVNELDDIICEQCQSKLFTPVFLLKKVPLIYTGTGKEELLPIQLFECAKCGHVDKSILQMM